jgi:putative oxidoreductase
MRTVGTAAAQNAAIAVLRIVIGVVFVMHGYQKLFVYGPAGVTDAMGKMGIPFPAVSAWLASLAEFGGGLAFLLGFGTRLAAIPLAVTMLVALFKVHLTNGFFLDKQGFEYVLTLLGGIVALGLLGSGAWSVDGLLGKRKARDEGG